MHSRICFRSAKPFVWTLAAFVIATALLALLAAQSPSDRRARMAKKKADRGKEIESQGVKVGEFLPPDIVVTTAEGAPAPLSSLWKDRPALLIACSLSCPVARGRQPMANRIAERFGERINVAMIYTIEAHPLSGPSPYYEGRRGGGENQPKQFQYRQSVSDDERLERARTYRSKLKAPMPILIDPMDNRFWSLAGEGPNLALLVGQDGKVVAKHGWFDGPSMESSIEYHLSQQAAGAR